MDVTVSGGGSIMLIAERNCYTEADGRASSEATYEVLSSDDSQPRCKLGVDVVSNGEKYRVRRFTVSGLPDGEQTNGPSGSGTPTP